MVVAGTAQEIVAVNCEGMKANGLKWFWWRGIEVIK